MATAVQKRNKEMMAPVHTTQLTTASVALYSCTLKVRTLCTQLHCGRSTKAALTRVLHHLVPLQCRFLKSLNDVPCTSEKILKTLAHSLASSLMSFSGFAAYSGERTLTSPYSATNQIRERSCPEVVLGATALGDLKMCQIWSCQTFNKLIGTNIAEVLVEQSLSCQVYSLTS